MQDPIVMLETAGFTVKTISALPSRARDSLISDGSHSPKALTPMAEREATAMVEGVKTLRANGFSKFADYVQSVPIVFTADTYWDGSTNSNSVMSTLGEDGRTYAFALNTNAKIEFGGSRVGNPWSMVEGRGMVETKGADAAQAFTLQGAALHEMGHAFDFRVGGAAVRSLLNVIDSAAHGRATRHWVAAHVSDYGAASGSPQEAEAEQFAKVAMGRPLSAPFKAWEAAIRDTAATGDFAAGAGKLSTI